MAPVSFDKHYPNRKDWRRPYRKAQAVAPSCRPHGECGYCTQNRTHASNKRKQLAEEQIAEFLSQ